jgi:hypothetical protein
MNIETGGEFVKKKNRMHHEQRRDVKPDYK